MPRQARVKSESGIYHLVLRGINKQNIFEDEEDRKRFLETLDFYKNKSGYLLYGFCLLDNHIHLLLKEQAESVSQAIKRISSSYVYWYNQKYERCGHLFQERFKSEAVETEEYFLVVLRYIHQNPLKAGITKHIRKYLWSSYQDYVKGSGITDIDFALDVFSTERTKAVALFKDYTSENNTDACLDYAEKVVASDKAVMQCLQAMGLASISQLQQLPKEQRDETLRQMKTIAGTTIRQLARMTGISKSVIDRV
ncbi:transposase [Sporomusa sphaeroides]|uniref:Transposase IS200 like protein n=1 Tax=Sporomusa sphaeroides DSM 2875 TaxID=1337886 RepID=A0ABP2CDN1_9FIRM|nr:transposase [Sporomusa sphaeroides]OLS54600.1 transposase IS200 like protein [Sporomusa sphaeroides DSM 2875]CVK20869.1 Transposase IS200 like protein [Sporomusa sphaeroides DSM 2875]